eukprot:COSAG05_NODE_22524_length_264_cov_0.630303_1_plen_52_part_10
MRVLDRVPDVLQATAAGGWVGFETYDGASFTAKKWSIFSLIGTTLVMSLTDL